MVKNMKQRIYLLKIWVVAFTLLCCTAGSLYAANDKPTLRMALLPVPDVLPIYVAEENGYFEEEGIEVEALPVGSAVERDQLMQAGRVDGMINEVSGAALFNRQSSQMKIVSFARIPMGDIPLFRILAAPNSDISTVQDLKDVAIAVSKNTVIEYVTDKMLVDGGIDKTHVVTSSVPVLPERLQLLLAGQIKAATLPDPLGYAALQAGAIEIVNDVEISDFSASVVSFSTEATEQHSDTVTKFMRAWDKAAAALNKDPESFRPLMLKKIRVPKNARETYPIPQFPRHNNVSKEQWDDAISWLLEKDLIKSPVSYKDSVTNEFLPR